MADDRLRVVDANDWHDAVASAKAEGYDHFDSLHAIDEVLRPSGEVEELRVVIRLVRHTEAGEDAVQLHTRVPREAGVLPTVADLFAGADWHEREAHDFFGVRFAGGDDRPLLWRPSAPGHPPLLKDALLVARAATPWPGGKDPDDDGRAQASRRRMLPAGVPDPDLWQPGADPSDIATAVSGARVRRRR